MAKNQYTKNSYLLEEITKCREKWQKACHNNPDANPVWYVSDDLARSLMLISQNLAKKSNFRNYTYIDDMIAESNLALVTGCLKFNPEKSSNSFGYLTQIAWNSFVNFLNKEKKQRNIRDEKLIDIGELPSWTKQIEWSEQYHTDFSQENID